MKMILAVIYLCNGSAGCEQVTARVEPKACKIGTIKIERPHEGQWIPSTFKVACKQ